MYVLQQCEIRKPPLQQQFLKSENEYFYYLFTKSLFPTKHLNHLVNKHVKSNK